MAFSRLTVPPAILQHALLYVKVRDLKTHVLSPSITVKDQDHEIPQKRPT